MLRIGDIDISTCSHETEEIAGDLAFGGIDRIENGADGTDDRKKTASGNKSDDQIDDQADQQISFFESVQFFQHLFYKSIALSVYRFLYPDESIMILLIQKTCGLQV
jgi:hypothetical protein